MEIGAYIEDQLAKRNLTKQDLHQLLKRVFLEHFPLAYNTFSQKIANNNLNALELFQIASVLDLDLNQLTHSLKRKFDISLGKEREQLMSLDLDSSIGQTFFAKSPYLRELREQLQLEPECFSFRIVKRHKNLYEMISFVRPGFQAEMPCRVEALDLSKQELRVIGACDYPIGFDANSIQTLGDWEGLGQLIKDQSAIQFILFPEVTTFESPVIPNEIPKVFSSDGFLDYFSSVSL